MAEGTGVLDPEAVEEGGGVADLAAHRNGKSEGEGRSIEDRVADGEHEDAEDDGTPQLVLPGTASPLTTNVGGKRPQSSTFKLAAISLPISGGELKVGDRGWVAVEYEVTDVGVKAHKNGRTTTTLVRHHSASPYAVELLDRPLVDE